MAISRHRPEINALLSFSSPSARSQVAASARPSSRRLTAVIAMALAVTASGLVAVVPASASPVSTPTTQPGPVMAWGNNELQQVSLPVGLTNVTAVAAGRYSSLALKSDGTVVGWGRAEYGSTAPVPAGLTGVTAIAAGAADSFALKSDGTVVAWGEMGQYRIGAYVPAGLSGVTAIAAGGDRALALKSDGTVVEWTESYNRNYIPMPSGLSGVTAIAVGGDHSLALKSDGTVVAWGAYTDHQATYPGVLDGVIAIAAGEYHSMALKADGTVVAWGNGGAGETYVPTDLSGVVAISAGYGRSLALKSDGSIVGWGSSEYIDGKQYHYFANGDLVTHGKFVFDPRDQVTQPTTVPGAQKIASGAFHTLAVASVLSTAPAFTTESPYDSIPAGMQLNVVHAPDDKFWNSFVATGNPAPTFAVSSGKLPDGLSVSASGELIGTATVAGSYTYTVTASNGILPNAVGVSHTMVVRPGVLKSIKVAALGAKAGTFATAYKVEVGKVLRLTATGYDAWGNTIVDQKATFTTDTNPYKTVAAIRGNSITFYTGGPHVVTATIGNVSTRVSVSVWREPIVKGHFN